MPKRGRKADKSPDDTHADTSEPTPLETPSAEVVPDTVTPEQVAQQVAENTHLPDEQTSHADKVQPRKLHGEPAGGITRAQRQPNPFAEGSILLTDSNDGPRIRLYRENGRFESFSAIEFPEKPSDHVRQMLKDGGFQRNQGQEVWKKRLGEHRGTEHRKAQELFAAIGDAMRQENGLPPTLKLGRGVE